MKLKLIIIIISDLQVLGRGFRLSVSEPKERTEQRSYKLYGITVLLILSCGRIIHTLQSEAIFN